MKPDLGHLIVKAKRSLDSAAALRERGDHDFAVSRAYYAMFYMVEALLWSLNQSFSSHSATLAAYGKEFAKTARLDPKFHRWLIEAESWRKTGDYDTLAGISAEESEELCLKAEEFIAAAIHYLQEPAA